MSVKNLLAASFSAIAGSRSDVPPVSIDGLFSSGTTGTTPKGLATVVPSSQPPPA